MSSPTPAAALYAALRRPFEPADLEWRAIFAKKGTKGPFVLCAPYVNRPALINRLNQVCGIGGWQSDARVSAGHTYIGVGIRVVQTFDVHGLPDVHEWVWRWDGAGFLESDEKFKAVDAGKGDFSNAFKRACELFGIGLYLREVGHLFGIVNDNGRYTAQLKDGGACKWDPPGLEGRPSYPGEIPGYDASLSAAELEASVGLAEGSPPAREAGTPGEPPQPPAKPKAPSPEEVKAEIQRCRDSVRAFMNQHRLKVYHLDAVVETHPGLRERYASAAKLGEIGTMDDWLIVEELTRRNRGRWDDAMKELARDFPTGPERLMVLDELLDSHKVNGEERILIEAAKSVGWNDAVEYWIGELGKR